jgi:uncharacterized protein (DUF2062 family)
MTGKSHRRSLGRAVVEMYYRLRQQELDPPRVAWSVALGTWIGCLPAYGLHLALCLGVARLFRLNGALAYLAAHVNNPWSAPFLLFLETSLGHRLTRGRWLPPTPEALREAGALALGRDLLLGAAVAGAVLGSLLGIAAFGIARRRHWPFRADLINRVSASYQPFGLRTWESVRGKLRHDPVYLGLLRSGALPAGGRLVDLGCGRGILFATLVVSRETAVLGEWPGTWPPPPGDLELIGYELDPGHATVARLALAGRATVHTADVRKVELPACDAVTLLDALHYLEASAQEGLIARAAAALRPGGVLLIREADADGGLRFQLTRLQERASSWCRLEWRRQFHYRSAADWRALVERHGLAVESAPMGAGTPFANVLILGRMRGGAAQRAGAGAPAFPVSEGAGGTGSSRSSRR